MGLNLNRIKYEEEIIGILVNESITLETTKRIEIDNTKSRAINQLSLKKQCV